MAACDCGERVDSRRLDGEGDGGEGLGWGVGGGDEDVGLAALPLWVMEQGARWTLFVAHWIAGLDGSVTAIPAPGPWVLPLFTLGAQAVEATLGVAADVDQAGVAHELADLGDASHVLGTVLGSETEVLVQSVADVDR